MLALGAGLTAALLLSEAGVRLAWRNLPPRVGAAESLPIVQVRDPRVLYRLIPRATAVYGGTPIEINSMGLRDRELPPVPAADAFRVLVLGDSMVFGLGVEQDQTLPAHLSRLLSPHEAINAGVFGYNLRQEISLLRDVGIGYRPGLVVSCFVHNDIDNWGLGDGGAVPEIRSSRFEQPPVDAWSTRLADMMLPGTFDEEHLNLLPGPEARGGFRSWVASWSRLYLFTYVRLRTHAWNLTSGERRDPIVDVPACRTEEVIWEPLRQEYRELRRLSSAAGAELAVVIQGGLLWEGGPLERLHRLLGEEGIPFLDLTPVWHDPEHYAREYSLGWDPHPSARAHALTAELVAAFLREAGLLPGTKGAGRAPGPYDVIAARDDLAPGLDSWRRRQDELIREERESWARRLSSLPGAVDFREEGADPNVPQLLYGFWEPGRGAALPGNEGPGLWMSGSGGVLLRKPRGASAISIELAVPEPLSPPGGPAARLSVWIGQPPDRCRLASVEVPLVRHPPDPLLVRAGFPDSMSEAGVVEVGLAVDRTFPASDLSPGAARDPRRLSVRLRRITVE